MVSPAVSIDYELTRGRGRIELIIGPMFSGKTTELLRRIKRYKVANFNCLLFKYEGDNRYSDTKVATHDLQMLPAISCRDLEEFKDMALGYEVIGIDEGHFFASIIKFAESLANLGKIVVIAGLDGTYQRAAFGEILNLVPLAENVIKLNAICLVCFGNASFTKRVSDEKEIEVIGSSDKYMAVCRECYHLNDSYKINVNLSPIKQ